MSTTSRKHCVGGDSCQPRSFEEAADCLGHHSKERLPGIAAKVSRDYNYLAKAFSPFAEEHPLRGDLIVPVTLARAELPYERNYTLLDWMEQQVGRLAFTIPQINAGNGFDRAGILVTQQAIEDFGRMLATSGQALGDGHLDADEYADVKARHAAALRALCAFGAFIDSIAPPGVK